jgi:hypothetical protein
VQQKQKPRKESPSAPLHTHKDFDIFRATMAPHLLTLPREIRNNIYQYLHHPVETDCLVDEVVVDGLLWKDEGAPGILEIQVTVEQAPIVNVMLVHSRIYEEYRESLMFKNYSATFKVAHMANLVRPLNRLLTSSLGPILPHLSRATFLFERNPENRFIFDKFETSILRKQGLRSLNIVVRKRHNAMPLETVNDAERAFAEYASIKYQGQAAPAPPPGMTLIQTGRGASWDACGCWIDHIVAHYSYRISSYASRSGDEYYWTPEVVLAFYPRRRASMTLEDWLSKYPNMSAVNFPNLAMSLGNMPLWSETRKDISSDITDSITTAYLQDKSFLRQDTVAGLNREAVARLERSKISQ